MNESNAFWLERKQNLWFLEPNFFHNNKTSISKLPCGSDQVDHNQEDHRLGNPIKPFATDRDHY